MRMNLRSVLIRRDGSPGSFSQNENGGSPCDLRFHHSPLTTHHSRWVSLSTGEDRPKVCFGKDASDFFAFVSLDFDLAILDRSANSTRLLHRPRQALFFRQTNPDKSFDDGNRLAAASGLLPDDIHPSAILALARRSFVASVLRLRRCLRARRQILAGQASERIVTKFF